ncbi:MULTISPECIES: hypothetical protein [unclassified Nostoc]|uniref:hypothetical protein n=1 Tax=unclassified Nostoc TaxID=2593658 RepID=UPI001DC9ABB9|nr:hypothetical protein [Nostoc sp. JL34]MBN3884602.1 hypothetical protein [Nostoc sp. JL34]
MNDRTKTVRPLTNSNLRFELVKGLSVFVYVDIAEGFGAYSIGATLKWSQYFSVKNAVAGLVCDTLREQASAHPHTTTKLLHQDS